jgi:hypothetical protein
MNLNVILAEDNPLHLAVIYRNVDQVEQYIDDKNVYDKAGRNPLHLATNIEPRYVDWKSCFIEVSIEAIEYLRNIDILKKMVKFNYADHDKLFQWNAMENMLSKIKVLFQQKLSYKDANIQAKNYISISKNISMMIALSFSA